MNDKRHGEWVLISRGAWGWSDGYEEEKGSYVDDKRHGQWVERVMAGGKIVRTKTSTYVNGEKQ